MMPPLMMAVGLIVGRSTGNFLSTLDWMVAAYTKAIVRVLGIA